MIQQHFGCRLFSHVSTTPQKSKTFPFFQVKAGERCIKDQSQTMIPPKGLSGVYMAELMNPAVFKWRNVDGAGITINGRQMDEAQAKKHAGAVGDLLEREGVKANEAAGTTVLAHIRATTGSPVNEENVQPFHYSNTAFAHNGDLGNQILSPAYRSRIERLMPDYKLGEQPSDSKTLFGVYLSELKLRYGTADQDKLSPNQIQQTLFDVCHHATSLNPLDIVSLDPKATHIPVHGEMDWSRASNFILSTGNDVYAYRSKLALWFCPIQNEKGEVVDTRIQSEPPQRSEAAEEKGSKQEPAWYEVPDNSLLHVRTQKNGTQDLELVPFMRLQASARPLEFLTHKLNLSLNA